MEHSQSQKIKIPDNLDKLAQQLIRELICRQPTNIYEFSANFFDNLLREREESKIECRQQ